MPRNRSSGATARRAATLVAALVACAVPAGTAAAHVHLASTTPSEGSRARHAPSTIVLRFTQPVDARTAVLRVVDQRGSLVAAATRAGGEGVVRATLREPLSNGDYAVGYRVLAADGHAMSGAVTFAVAAPRGGAAAARSEGGPGATARPSRGTGATAARPSRGTDATAAHSSRGTGSATAAGASRRPGAATAALARSAVPRDAAWTGPALIGARAGQYTGLVLGLGGLTFLLLAWWPAVAAARPGRDDPEAASWRRTLGLAVAVGGLTAAAGWLAHAFDAAGAGPTTARVLGGLRDPAALLWLEATACWIVAAVLLRRSPRLTPRTAKRLLAPLAGALLATALSGHGGSDGNLPAVAAAIAHGTAATMWIGAIAWLMIAMRRGDARREAQAPILRGAATRASRLSLAAALATLASGTIQAIALAGGPLTLPHSSYGRLVLAKLALFAGLVALGAVHRRRALPALSATAPAAAGGRPLRATLRAELAIAALLLGAAGLLTGSAPPRSAEAAAPTALAAGR